MPQSSLVPALTASVTLVGFLTAFTLAYWSVKRRIASRTAVLDQRLGPIRSSSLSIFVDRSRDGRFMAPLRELLIRAGVVASPAQVAWVLGALVLVTFGVGASSRGVAFGLVLATLVGLLPFAWLHRRSVHRSQVLTKQLPATIDAVSRAVRAGRGFADALGNAVEEAPEPLGGLLRQTVQRYQLGRDLREGLDEAISVHPDNFDLRLFASAVLLNKETGSNLLEALEKLASTIRERLVFQRKVAAAFAEVRVSTAILALLPVIVVGALLLLRPGYLDPLVTTEIGLWISLFAALWVALGLMLMRLVSRMEVL